jgi:hypothetical protein
MSATYLAPPQGPAKWTLSLEDVTHFIQEAIRREKEVRDRLDYHLFILTLSVVDPRQYNCSSDR